MRQMGPRHSAHLKQVIYEWANLVVKKSIKQTLSCYVSNKSVANDICSRTAVTCVHKIVYSGRVEKERHICKTTNSKPGV